MIILSNTAYSDSNSIWPATSLTVPENALEEPRFVSLRQELGQTFQQRILSLASDINYVAGDIRNSVETSIPT